jgi:hypothetical protein
VLRAFTTPNRPEDATTALVIGTTMQMNGQNTQLFLSFICSVSTNEN